MAISRSGEIYTRLYEFDVSGGNSLFFDYSWQDQDDVVIVPISTYRNRIQGGASGKLRRVGSISVKVREGQSMRLAEENIKDLLRQRMKVQPGAGEVLVRKSGLPLPGGIVALGAVLLLLSLGLGTFLMINLVLVRATILDKILGVGAGAADAGPIVMRR